MMQIWNISHCGQKLQWPFQQNSLYFLSRAKMATGGAASAVGNYTEKFKSLF